MKTKSSINYFMQFILRASQFSYRNYEASLFFLILETRRVSDQSIWGLDRLIRSTESKPSVNYFMQTSLFPPTSELR